MLASRTRTADILTVCFRDRSADAGPECATAISGWSRDQNQHQETRLWNKRLPCSLRPGKTVCSGVNLYRFYFFHTRLQPGQVWLGPMDQSPRFCIVAVRLTTKNNPPLRMLCWILQLQIRSCSVVSHARSNPSRIHNCHMYVYTILIKSSPAHTWTW